MDSQRIEFKLKEIISLVLKVDREIVDEGFTLDNNGKWDSLQLMTLVSVLEEEFGIEFMPEQIGVMNSYLSILKEIKLGLSPDFNFSGK